MKNKYIVIAALALVAVLALAACTSAGGGGGATTNTQVPVAQATVPACPTAPACPAVPTPVEPVVQEVPNQDEWANSPHNDKTAEAFNRWNEESPAEIPENCAKCHSTPGYIDFVGADGSEAGKVDKPAPVGTTIQCVACHNAATAKMTSVTFPSGTTVENLGPEARCMQCHQGRASKVQIDTAIATNALTDTLDAPSEKLNFINIHYYAAAATLYGTVTKGGYEYAGKSYDAKNDHVAGYNTCIGCHNSHTLQIKVDECAACHQGVASQEDLRNIRMAGSQVDYDGDGNIEEGIADEMAGMQEKLLAAIQAYSQEKLNNAIGYNPAAYPYFFTDPNGDGTIDEAEATEENAFKGWSPRLLKAAYNYQTSVKDPGAFAHGGKYIIELLYDSTEDLNSALSSPVDMTGMNRIDAGHFAGSEQAFRRWDEEGMVPADCAKCHSATGLPIFMREAEAARDKVSGIVISQPTSNGLNCATCHNDLTAFTRYAPAQVKFPSGAILDIGETDSNLCMECHQGRESTVSVNRAIQGADVGDDEVSDALAFRNPHYFATASTLMGTEAKGAYEYEGQEYNTRLVHVEAFNTCKECHNVHALTVKAEACGACHSGVATEEDVTKIRMTAVDFDGDGDTTEGLANEVATMHEALLTAIQTYAADTAGTPIQYNANAYPYFYADPNGNGEIDEGEAAYNTWTPRLLRAAYNYQWVAKDPGAFAHNGMYILQVLYDSLNDIGGDVTGMTRPEVKAAPEATPAP